MSEGHLPVMLPEMLAALAPQPGDLLLDGTFGGGGYARAILEAADCRLFAIDRDPAAIARAQALESYFPGRLTPIEGRFGDLDQLVPEALDGVVLDLGVSSFQLDQAERGFSFRFDAPLDMRMGEGGKTAADAVNHLPEEALADVLFYFGEERDSRRIARLLVAARKDEPIATTAHLASLVEKAVGGRRGAKIHPATRAFQALRILINDELGELARGLSAAESRLQPGGRLVVVAFHSLEDRLVKSFFAERGGAGPGGSRHAPEAKSTRAPSFDRPMKAIGASDLESDQNPRARSARLRAAVRSAAPAWGEYQADLLPPSTRAAWESLAC